MELEGNLYIEMNHSPLNSDIYCEFSDYDVSKVEKQLDKFTIVDNQRYPRLTTERKRLYFMLYLNGYFFANLFIARDPDENFIVGCVWTERITSASTYFACDGFDGLEELISDLQTLKEKIINRGWYKNR